MQHYGLLESFSSFSGHKVELNKTYTISSSILDRLNFNSPEEIRGNFVGGGYQAKVYTLARRPHEVVKYLYLGDLGPQDSHIQYIKVCHENQERNPFLPRIHAAKIYKVESEYREDTLYEAIVVMERLYPVVPSAFDQSVPLFNAMLRNSGLYDAFSEYLEERRTPQEFSVLISLFFQFVSTLVFPITSELRNKSPMVTHDRRIEIDRNRNIYRQLTGKNIRLAMMYIRKILKREEHRARPDMWRSNFMFRKTPVGPHLVITDPVVSIYNQR